MYQMFLMAKLTTMLQVRKGIPRAMAIFQKQWHVFQDYCHRWALNEIHK